jgi:hypothetical protein
MKNPPRLGAGRAQTLEAAIFEELEGGCRERNPHIVDIAQGHNLLSVSF